MHFGCVAAVASEFFDRHTDQGRCANSDTWTALFGCFNLGEHVIALLYFGRMLALGHAPDRWAVSALASLCSKSGRPDASLALIELLESRGEALCALLLQELATARGQLGGVDDALIVLRHMRAKGVPVRGILLERLIKMCALEGSPRRGTQLIRESLAAGDRVFQSVLGYCSLGDADILDFHGGAVLQSRKSYWSRGRSFCVNWYTVHALLALHAAEGRLKVGTMLIVGGSPDNPSKARAAVVDWFGRHCGAVVPALRKDGEEAAGTLRISVAPVLEPDPPTMSGRQGPVGAPGAVSSRRLRGDPAVRPA